METSSFPVSLLMAGLSLMASIQRYEIGRTVAHSRTDRNAREMNWKTTPGEHTVPYEDWTSAALSLALENAVLPLFGHEVPAV